LFFKDLESDTSEGKERHRFAQEIFKGCKFREGVTGPALQAGHTTA